MTSETSSHMGRRAGRGAQPDDAASDSARVGRRVTRVVAIALALIGWLALSAPGSAAQQTSASAPNVTAALLLNFAKFTEWPADVLTPDAPLLLCTTDSAVAEALATVVEGKSVGKRAVTFSYVPLEPAPRQCAVLYASRLDAKRIAALVASLRGTSVLSVGDSDEFTRSGGVVHLYLDGDRMRFAVNVTAAERARLHMSSRLLMLAKIVKE